VSVSECVCVKRLHRRKTSFLYITFYIIFQAGGHRGPGGIGDNEDTSPGPV